MPIAGQLKNHKPYTTYILHTQPIVVLTVTNSGIIWKREEFWSQIHNNTRKKKTDYTHITHTNTYIHTAHNTC